MATETDTMRAVFSPLQTSVGTRGSGVDVVNADASGGDGVVDFDQQFVIEVRNRFDGSWSHGFEIVEHVAGTDPRFRLRRLSDGHILPALFSADDVLISQRPNPFEPRTSPA